MNDYPKKAVDGHVLRWWEVWCDGESIQECTATYHRRTRWRDYSPERPWGADLVDDWMIARNGGDDGRCCGWDSMRGYFQEGRHFPTREAAVRHALDRCARRRRRAEEELARVAEVARRLGLMLPIRNSDEPRNWP